MSIGNRIRKLEEERRRGPEPPCEAFRRLTEVELAVMEELLELRTEHPDVSGADFHRLMTDVQHTMERRWSQVVKEVVDELAPQG